MDKKLIRGLLIGGAVIVIGGGVLFYGLNIANKNGSSKNQTGNEDFQKMGQYSFGVDVCNEMTKEVVGETLEKTIIEASTYSNSYGTGCHYETLPDKKGTVTINVVFGEAAKQKNGNEVLGRRVETIGGIGLENFAVYSKDSPEHIIDIYMVMDPSQKYVRISKLGIAATDNEHLIALAQKTEEKIRSYK